MSLFRSDSTNFLYHINAGTVFFVSTITQEKHTMFLIITLYALLNDWFPDTNAEYSTNAARYLSN